MVLYPRVSSTKQKEAGELQRPIQTLRSHCPDKLLTLVEEGRVSKVVVTYRDRLAHFGVELLERTFRPDGTQLVVISRQQVPPDSNQELADDLLAVCKFFVAKNNGRPAAALARDRRKCRISCVSKKRKRAQEARESQPWEHR